MVHSLFTLADHRDLSAFSSKTFSLSGESLVFATKRLREWGVLRGRTSRAGHFRSRLHQKSE